MTPQDTFITRLRRHRERNRISIHEIVATTRVKRELIDAFERGDLSAWPRGLYARAWVRGYASAIGLDPIDTVDEFCRLFPQGDRRTGGTVQEMAAIVAHNSEYRDEFSHQDRRRTSPQVNMMGKPGWDDLLRQMAKNGWPKLAALFGSYATGTNRPRALSRIRAMSSARTTERGEV
jgi:hypothetical protein